MSVSKFNRSAGQHVWRVTGDDINNYERSDTSKSEALFYSVILVIGILALGIVWQ
ncbi:MULTISPECIES: hypothetical protein [Serratia]|uniref:Uncharacterized protein n=1 Tax=Serratia proteamaculans TaxID=28151 RepID=A0ABS0TRZ2_SERPR|nr:MULTISPECIES: hypothetical protein [Serratia]MBI6181117.1 hypothetical protein [Serratia proteamaculans]CAI1109406.1 Uncharacterised protein [Serratia quinivorans]HEJ7884136.1 hypothetical protein [Serratia liquefaciens]